MTTTFTFNNQPWTVPTDFEGNKYDPAFEEFLTDFVSHYGSGKHNFSATAAPTTGDDSGDGYDVGSFWFDVSNDDVYACVDATSTAAVWAQLNGGGSSTTVTTGITASTTQTQGQGALTSNINVIATCANDNDTVTLPTAAAGIWAMVINEGAEELQVFPASGDNLGEGSNTATVLKPGEKEIFWAVDATNWKRESQNFKIDSVLGGSTVGHNLKNSDNGDLVLRMATDDETRRILGRNGANDTTRSGIEMRDSKLQFLGASDANIGDVTAVGFYHPNQSIGGPNSEVHTSTTKTAVMTYSVPANALGTGNAVEFEVYVEIYNNSGGGVNYTLTIEYGSTTLWADVVSIGNNSQRGGVQARGLLTANGSTGAQVLGAQVQFNTGSGTSAGNGGLGFPSAAVATGSSSEDSTGALDLKVSVTMGTSHADARFTKINHKANVLRAS